ncbi:hypothetical protein AB0M48_00120 [Lentzea sp. NPDC051208]|uniref:hypothetical protein n=1 Tax=Lentzea sp. NPDC051208 TaxID=3154642 RepID=UPI003436038A
MFRKATAAALVLSAVPAVLTMTFLAGTAQADDTRRTDGVECDARWTHIAADGDTPWGAVTFTDTPWGRSIRTSGLPINGDSSQRGDTPWG